MHTLILSIIQITLTVTATIQSTCILFPSILFFVIYSGRNYNNRRRKTEQESTLSTPPRLDSIKWRTEGPALGRKTPLSSES